SLIGQNVTVTGTIIDDPSLSDKGLLTFKLGYLKLGGRDLPGELTVRLYRLQLQRGYQIQATGKVKPGFGNAVAELGFPQTQVVSRQQDWLEQLRQRFFVGIRTALPEPIASFGLGLLVGIRALIPKAMQTELTLVGLSHLVAVSGYNLTIIVQAVDRALGRFGRSVALAASLWLIAGFLILTGASASIVRASLVSVLSLLAAFYGRRFDPLALILVAASLTAMYDPKYLTDLGWLLSFLAFFGILVLAPALEARLGHPKPVLVRLFIESFAAQITTTPLILYFFGQLSIVAPVSNLIILPMVPLAMALSFAAGLAGMLLPAFAGWLAWPAMLLLTFMTQIVSQFAALPWAGTTMHIDLLTMLAMYALTVLVVIAIKRANRSRGIQEDHDHMFESIHT
ncbi:MAG: rane protein of unknown function, partial [Patescibacteria group bacterium]|nr:rane protein of unknown function [Patescibacteria group bacterium]